MADERPSMYALKKAGMAPKVINQPEEGYYETRPQKDGPWLPVQIWFGPSKDPATGEECDRSPQWQALQDGQPVDAYEIWPYCCARPISREQYMNMLMEDL